MASERVRTVRATESIEEVEIRSGIIAPRHQPFVLCKGAVRLLQPIGFDDDTSSKMPYPTSLADSGIEACDLPDRGSNT